MRYYEQLPNKTRIIKAIRCDRCQEYVPVSQAGFEVATLAAKFNMEHREGSSFLFDFCPDCFDDIAETVLILEEGTCHYENDTYDMEYEDVLAM